MGSLACGDSGGSDGVADETGGATCEPGEEVSCACPDGTNATQVCNEDGMSFGACMCGDETGDSADTTGDGDGDTMGDGDGDTTGDGDGDTTGDGDGDTTGDGDGDGDTVGDGDGDPPGEDPVASIFHPGDGEVRPVDVPIPFIGEATDAEDGMLSGMSMVWTSDLEGQIGVGESFDAPLTMVGVHTITLTATDSDGQQGFDSLMLTIE